MKYEDGQTVMLGDIVRVDLHDGDHVGRVIMIGDTGEYENGELSGLSPKGLAKSPRSGDFFATPWKEC